MEFIPIDEDQIPQSHYTDREYFAAIAILIFGMEFDGKDFSQNVKRYENND